MALRSFAAAFGCLALLYTLMPRLQRGLPRLLLLLSCLPAFAWVPFSTRSDALRPTLAFSFLWICPSKLLLLSWDLSPEDSLSHGFLYFVVTTLLPVRVKGQVSTSASRKQGALSPNILKIPLFLVVLNACRFRESLNFWQIHALYCLLLFFGLELILGLASKLAIVLLGVETYPYSDNPFIASSLSEFWSRRWNLVATHMLRLTVYAPILRFLSGGQGQDSAKKNVSQGRSEAGRDGGTMEVKTQIAPSPIESMQTGGLQQDSVSKHQNLEQESLLCTGYGKSQNTARHPLPARALAMLATFLMSGLIHELIFCCINQAQATWEVTMFFTLQGFATVLEGFLRKRLPSSWKLPWPVSIFCTLGFIFFTAAWLFMPPVMQTGSDVRILADFNHWQSVIVHPFRRQ